MGITQASAASIVACLALLCVPAVSMGADPSDSSADAAGRAGELLARGAGYGQPQGESRVRALQRRLRALGHRPGPVDGRFGPRTEAAVESLQRGSGLSADGIVGPQTRRVLAAEAPPLVPGAGYGRPRGSRQVRSVQRRLRALGQRPGPVDGRYGPRTKAAIERFQRSAGQPASGVLSRATATALARGGGDRPARAASDARPGNDPGRQGRSSAGRVEASVADDRPPAADASAPAEPSDDSKPQTPVAVVDRTTGTDGGGSKSPVPLLGLAIALAAGGALLAVWLMRTRGKPKAGGMEGRTVRPQPKPDGGAAPATNGAGQAAGTGAGKVAQNGSKQAVPNRAKKAAPNGNQPNGAKKKPQPTPVASAPPSPNPDTRTNGAAAALGYVSVREPDAGGEHEVEDQTAAITAACRERGLVLKEVVRDLEQADETGPAPPGMAHALQRLAAGDASCLVVAELGRLSRSSPRLGSILEWLRRQDARLVSVDEGLDTDTKSGGEAARKLVSICAFEGQQRESARLAQPGRVQDPVGIDSARAELKERIRKMRAGGMTLQAIADRLNQENVPTLRGGARWRPSGVQRALGHERRVSRRKGRSGGGAR